ncbi:MAG TPA: hypothetical protein VFO60_08800, partial [Candidatus Dormibacteraeota bacterium]|nr:hypothetical protein [Candidatus Dormibacteraeota bacterium]
MTTGATGEAGRRLAVSRARGRRMDVAGAVASLLLLLAVGGFTLALTTPYDYVEHALVAQRWHDGLSQPPPHFFYELLVVAVHDVWSAASWERAGKLVALVFYALLGAVLFAVWRRRTAPSGAGADAGAGPRLAAAVIAAPALALAAPVFLLTVADRNLYVGYVAADAYHNPTIVVLRPLALLLFLLVVEALDGERAASLPALAGIAVLSGLGAFAKPNYALAFVPALVAVCALRWRAGRSLRLDVVSAVVAPLLVVLPVELVLYRHLGTGGGFTLDPLGPLRIDATLFDHGAYTSAGWVLVKLVLSVPTALAVTALAFREVARDTAM